MYYVYLLHSKQHNKFYIGYSSNLKDRVVSHNAGKNNATRPFIPYKLIYYEAFRDKKDAKAREVYLKSGWGWRSIRKIIKNYLENN